MYIMVNNLDFVDFFRTICKRKKLIFMIKHSLWFNHLFLKELIKQLNGLLQNLPKVSSVNDFTQNTELLELFVAILVIIVI